MENLQVYKINIKDWEDSFTYVYIFNLPLIQGIN